MTESECSLFPPNNIVYIKSGYTFQQVWKAVTLCCEPASKSTRPQQPPSRYHPWPEPGTRGLALADMHVRSMLPAVVSCLLSVSKSVTTFKKFGVNEFAGGLLLSRRPCVRQQPGTRVADHGRPHSSHPRQHPDCIQTPRPWDTLGLVGGRG